MFLPSNHDNFPLERRLVRTGFVRTFACAVWVESPILAMPSLPGWRGLLRDCDALGRGMGRETFGDRRPY